MLKSVLIPLFSRNVSSCLDGKQEFLGGLKMFSSTNQVEDVIALAGLFERMEDCEQEEMFEW